MDNVDGLMLAKRYQTAFDCLPKDELLTQFPELSTLVSKHEAASSMYREKLNPEKAEHAARILIEKDFEALAFQRPILASYEMNTQEHTRVIERALQEKTVKKMDLIGAPEIQPEVEPQNTPAFTQGVLSETVVDLAKLHATAPAIDTQKWFETTVKPELTQPKKYEYDVNEISGRLQNKTRELAIHLLGEPMVSNAKELRFGSNKGSLVVTVAGQKEGLWYDHQSGGGGNLLTLIQNTKNIGFKEALAFASDFLGDAPALPSNSTWKEPLEKEEKSTLPYAKKLIDQSKPIQGTLAEKYLQTVRKVDASLASQNVRFLPSVKEPETGTFNPAVLLVCKDHVGEIQGAQVIFLNKDGEKFTCKNPKRSYGNIKGAAISVHEGGAVYAVCEGAETALSIATAHPEMTVFASAGSVKNFSAMDLQGKNNTLIIFADNDGKNSKTNTGVMTACDELANKGFNVFVCKPKEEGKDFNDILRTHGLEALKKETSQLHLYKSHIKTQEKVRTEISRRTLEKKRDIDVGREF